ncbi:MAG: hypothetical protein IKH30_00150 [Clostridia bacterium]|nr:hypothetical protein [Clostridia bacterium]
MALMLMVSVASAATIEVKSVIDGETYTAYKILNYTDNGKTGDDRAVSYYLLADEYTSIGSVLVAAGFAFTASSDGTQYFVNNAETFDAATVAAYLGEHVTDLGDALGKATATGANGEANFTSLDTGYYFVTSSVGSLCALHEDGEIAKVVEKNTIPTVDKTQSENEGSYADTTLHENVGDIVYYQLEVTDGTGTDAAITLTDVMTAGLTYNAGTIKINGSAVADDANTDDW